MNTWQRFLRRNKGSGKTMAQLSKEYREQNGAGMHAQRRGMANVGGVFPRLAFDRAPVPTGTFVGRGSWNDALEDSELDVAMINARGQDRLRVYDTRKKSELGFIPPNGSLFIRLDSRRYKVTWTCPVDERGRIDFESDAIKKQTLKIQKL